MARQRPKTSRPDRAPVANENAGALKQTLAPWPLTDRTPTILGSNLSVAYLASVYRICQNGYRQQYVDVLDELLEKDNHAQSVLSQRVLAVAGGHVEIVPAHVFDPDGPEAEKAKEIAADIQRRVDAIPRKTKAFHALLLAAIYYGVAASEIHYDLGSHGWNVTGLGFIHSRRISYPDQGAWDAHIWDQGSVMPFGWGSFPTEGVFGLRVKNAPGKFILHAPQFRADYPTRDGLGRVMAWLMAIKLMAVRGAASYVERYGSPWATATFSTREPGQEVGRSATDADVAIAKTFVDGLANGTITSAVLPDSIKVVLDGPGVKGATGSINHKELIDWCDSQISKVVRGGTLTTDAGEKGARSLGEVHEQGDIRNARYDAACLADQLKEDLVWWLVHLNHPGFEHLCPNVVVHVEQITPEEILKRATMLAAMGVPVDGRELAAKLGTKLVDPDDENAIRCAPLKPVDLFALTASATDLRSALEALAAQAGVALTPAVKTAIAEMDRDDAARLIQAFMGAAKAGAKSAAEAGAATDDSAKPTKPAAKPGEKQAAKPAAKTKGAKRKAGKAKPAATSTNAPARGGSEDQSASADNTDTED